MEDGSLENSVKEITKSSLQEYFNKQDKSIKYSYKRIDNKGNLPEDLLDTINIDVLNLLDETEKYVNKELFSEWSEKNLSLYIRTYVKTFLLVIIKELYNHNVVVIDKRIMAFSLHTKEKLRKTRDGVTRAYNTLRIYVHISRALHKRSRILYYSHIYNKFSKRTVKIRKNVKYERYPNNYIT